VQVSVITPVFNAAPYLDRAIQSALDQPEVVELILIDDASTDGSDQILKSWHLKTNRIRYLPAASDRPQRAAAARNRGLAVATAPFVAFLDADDYYLPGRFTRTAAYFEAHPEMEGLIEPVEVRYDKNYKGPRLSRKKLGFQLTQSRDWSGLRYYDIINPLLPVSGWTFKRNIFHKIGFFEQRQYQKEDIDFLRRLIYFSIPVSIGVQNHTPVAVYYHHGSNTTLRNREVNTEGAKLELLWLKRLANNRDNKGDRFTIFYRYVIFKYKSAYWSRFKKVLIYPFLFIYEGLKLIRFLI